MTTFANNIRYGVNNWWWFLVMGFLSLVAGTAIIANPFEGYLGLSMLFSLVMTGTGISQIVFAISAHKFYRGWGWTLASGILDLAIGSFLLLYPGITMVTLPFFVGFYLIFRAVYLVGASLDLNFLGVRGWGWLFAGGIILLILGFVTFYNPLAGAYGIVAFSGSAFFICGVLSIIMAFQLKSIKKEIQNVENSFSRPFASLKEQYSSPY